MERYFNINYEFSIPTIHERIAAQVEKGEAAYICVADGVILNTANRQPDYLSVVNGSMFSICDSSFVPLYLRWIYGTRYNHYTGSQIFGDIIRQKRYRMFFMGTSQDILDALRTNLTKIDPAIENMTFYPLPFKTVDEFDYEAIARMVEADGADIIWVALGAPKQEIFMSRLRPHLKSGVMIAVGAAFKFYSGLAEKRAPEWMLKNHLEFVYRIYRDPKKQLKRCSWIVFTLPKLLWQESKRKRLSRKQF